MFRPKNKSIFAQFELTQWKTYEHELIMLAWRARYALKKFIQNEWGFFLHESHDMISNANEVFICNDYRFDSLFFAFFPNSSDLILQYFWEFSLLEMRFNISY